MLTRAVIEAGRQANGAWTREQLALLGVSWPPAKGWARALPEEILDLTAWEFVRRGELGQRYRLRPQDFPIKVSGSLVLNVSGHRLFPFDPT